MAIAHSHVQPTDCSAVLATPKWPECKQISASHRTSIVYVWWYSSVNNPESLPDEALTTPVTYVVFEVPSNMLIVRIRPSIYLPCLMTIWGALTCCMAAIKDYHHLVVLRIFVGVFEAGFSPAMLLLMSSWYKREEQSKRFGFYISAAILSGAFGGLLAGAITGGLDGAGGFEGWRWLFIVEGAATILVAMLSYFILVDFPATTARFSDREREIAVARLQQGGVTAREEGTERMSKVQSLSLAIKDWRTIGFILGYMVIPLSTHVHLPPN